MRRLDIFLQVTLIRHIPLIQCTDIPLMIIRPGTMRHPLVLALRRRSDTAADTTVEIGGMAGDGIMVEAGDIAADGDTGDVNGKHPDPGYSVGRPYRSFILKLLKTSESIQHARSLTNRQSPGAQTPCRENFLIFPAPGRI